MKNIIKMFSLFLVFLFAFTGICAFADSETGNIYYFKGFQNAETDEIEYSFNVKSVILPENYKPEVKVFYDGKVDELILPEYITLVFTDGTKVRCSPDNPPVLEDGNPLLIRYLTDNIENENGFSIEIYRESTGNSGYYPHASVFIECNKVEKSFGENISYFFNKIIMILKEFFNSIGK